MWDIGVILLKMSFFNLISFNLTLPTMEKSNKHPKLNSIINLTTSLEETIKKMIWCDICDDVCSFYSITVKNNKGEERYRCLNHMKEIKEHYSEINTQLLQLVMMLEFKCNKCQMILSFTSYDLHTEKCSGIITMNNKDICQTTLLNKWSCSVSSELFICEWCKKKYCKKCAKYQGNNLINSFSFKEIVDTNSYCNKYRVKEEKMLDKPEFTNYWFYKDVCKLTEKCKILTCDNCIYKTEKSFENCRKMLKIVLAKFNISHIYDICDFDEILTTHVKQCEKIQKKMIDEYPKINYDEIKKKHKVDITMIYNDNNEEIIEINRNYMSKCYVEKTWVDKYINIEKLFNSDKTWRKSFTNSFKNDFDKIINNDGPEFGEEYEKLDIQKFRLKKEPKYLIKFTISPHQDLAYYSTYHKKNDWYCVS